MSIKSVGSLIDYFITSAQRDKSVTAMLIRRRVRRESVSYGQIIELLRRTEAFFRQEKISVGDTILLWGMNCPEYAVVLIACFSFARVAVPVDFRTSREVVESVLDKVKPKYAFVTRYLKSEFLSDKNIRRIFLEDFFKTLVTVKSLRRIDELLQNKTYGNKEQTIEIVFTSGTTGTPKGVVIKQKHILANLAQIEPHLPNLQRARMVSVLPLSHMYEQIAGLLLPLSNSATIIYLPRITSFRLLEAFSEYRPTHQLFVPQLLKIIWDKIEDRAREKHKLAALNFLLRVSTFLPLFLRRLLFPEIHRLFGGCLQLIACGGAPLDPRIARNFINIGIPVYEGYGATEVTAVATMSPIGAIRYGSCGKSISGVEISLDENSEIYIKSPAVTAGYYLDQERTKAAYTNNGYRTGDIGELDRDGYLYIKGRDVFKIVLPNGEKVFVEDLETKIKADPRIKEVCAVAKKLADGDKVHAYFILNSGVTETLSTIVAEINKHLEPKQQILSFAIWPESDFPRTPTLKIDRRYMRDTANVTGQVNESKTNQTVNVLDTLDIITKVSGKKRSQIDDSQLLTTDLGLDSLSRTELASLAEEYLGVVIDESLITAKTTVGDLKRLIVNKDRQVDVKLPTWQFGPVAEKLHRWILKYLIFPLHSYIIWINYPQPELPRIQPGSIILFNHPGIADVFCVLRLLARQEHYQVVIDTSPSVWEKFYNKIRLLPFFSELITGSVPLYDAGHKLLMVLRLNADLLDRKYILLFAPQGRQQRSDIEDPFRLGTGYLVKELSRPVYIIAIKGYRALWPAPVTNVIESKLIGLLPHRRGTVSLYVSDPIIKDWTQFTPSEITKLLEKKYMEL